MFKRVTQQPGKVGCDQDAQVLPDKSEKLLRDVMRLCSMGQFRVTFLAPSHLYLVSSVKASFCLDKGKIQGRFDFASAWTSKQQQLGTNRY